MKRRKNYSDEFKVEAVAMVTDQGRSVKDVGEFLSVGASLLRCWVHSHGSEDKQGAMSQSKVPSSEQHRI